MPIRSIETSSGYIVSFVKFNLIVVLFYLLINVFFLNVLVFKYQLNFKFGYIAIVINDI